MLPVSFRKFSLTSPVAALKKHLKLEEDDENESEDDENERNYVASKVLRINYCLKLFEANNNIFHVFRQREVIF